MKTGTLRHHYRCTGQKASVFKVMTFFCFKIMSDFHRCQARNVRTWTFFTEYLIDRRLWFHDLIQVFKNKCIEKTAPFHWFWRTDEAASRHEQNISTSLLLRLEKETDGSSKSICLSSGGKESMSIYCNCSLPPEYPPKNIKEISGLDRSNSANCFVLE